MDKRYAKKAANRGALRQVDGGKQATVGESEQALPFHTRPVCWIHDLNMG